MSFDDGAEALVLGCRPGAEKLAATTWIEWLLTGDEAVRRQAQPNLARGSWQLGRWSWHGTALLQWVPPRAWFSVNAFYDVSGDHRLTQWYVNFQRPMHRTALGFDTFDLVLDLVIAPDLARWDWKDEGEYDHGRRLGVVSEADHRAVEKAREEAVAMIEGRVGPFATEARWRDWHSEPDWPTPALPDDVLALVSIE
ncbi:DUF402 domain-containing protein [Streptomyces sp. 6N223]|uniref:DUF402 domain-containing protein n=1 Tax=Streptomyces sp. 6N223 TaxID=3457412 RepID=UPI003FD2628C